MCMCLVDVHVVSGRTTGVMVDAQNNAHMTHIGGGKNTCYTHPHARTHTHTHNIKVCVCVAWLVLTSDVTHSHARHDSWMCVR